MPKITKIEQQKKNSNRYSIYIGDEFSFGIHENILVKFRLAKGMDLEESFIEEVLKEEEQNKANSYALKLLSSKARSENEIIDKMRNKGYEKDNIDKAINYLKQYGYIDDKEYALNYTRDRMRLKKLGHQRIKSELYQKGVKKEILEEALDELIDKDDEYERALELAQKKVSSTYKNDDKNTQYRKLGAFLQRKGYSFDTIKKVLNKVLKY